MTKWEYLRLEVHHDSGMFSEGKISYISSNGITILKNVERVDLQNLLSQMGSDGWDLVSVSTMGDLYCEVHYFKRSLEE